MLRIREIEKSCRLKVGRAARRTIRHVKSHSVDPWTKPERRVRVLSPQPSQPIITHKVLMPFQPYELETQNLDSSAYISIWLCARCYSTSVMRRFTTTVLKMSRSIVDEKVALRKRIKAVLSNLEPQEIEEQCSSLGTRLSRSSLC